MRYRTGKGFKKNLQASQSLLEKASVSSGSPRTKLAEIYLDGDEESQRKGYGLLVSAAKAGDADAYFALAQLYKEGRLCEQNEEMYRRYTRMAAERGCREAKDVVAKWDDRIRRRKRAKELRQ